MSGVSNRTAHRPVSSPATAEREAMPQRTRLSPAARSDLILRGAIRFFAERGFGGQTRELAQQLGITQGLLYRYFPTKDLLIERIYEELFVKRIRPEWEIGLTNRTEPLLQRLINFYLDYATMLHDYEWGRIYLYSGLGGATIAKRFVQQTKQGLFRRVIAELRHEFKLPDLDTAPMTEPETELMWSLHGSIFYIGIRVSVYGVPPPSDIPATVTQLVEQFYDNAKLMLRARNPAQNTRSE
ncbi:TetR/AcrR family transcriptional regulator [Bradyrhizobium sp. SYSU BS000235]|uniref:TetR/AcrR family transcriptional regulator n=1 Tax=Bradyrhizobium sp. SYSU BS000235 TaxID=3411332 RepID=UPI003C774C47